jgi:phospholipase A1
MKVTTLMLPLALALAPLLRAGDVSLNLLPPPGPQVAGTEIAVDLLWLNPGAEPQSVCPPAALDARLVQPQGTRPVRLRETEPATGWLTLERGGYARRTYLLTLPADVRDTAVLSVEQPLAAETTLEIVPLFHVTPARPDAPPALAATPLRPVASRLHRTVLENFDFHEPIYFIYGPDEPGAKFQLSFRYRLAGNPDRAVGSEPTVKGLYLAYTQRSLWNIKEPSSPFYDTSYMPELMFESLATERSGNDRLVNYIGCQAGYRHESNGRDGLLSRSLDIVYLRTGVLIGRRDGWRLLVVPRVFAYLGRSSDNDDIDDYRGFGELLLSLGRDDGLLVNATGMIGQGWNKGCVQVDATYPVKIPSVHFDTFLHVQYFNGYGESLRDYNRKSSTWRAGVSLVR